MQCQNCGFNITDEQKFCPECGKKVCGDVKASPLYFEGNPELEIDVQPIGEPKKVSPSLSVVSFVLGIAGCIGYCICCPSFIFSLVAIILGIRSLNTDKKGLSVAGIILGFVGILIPLFLGLLLLLLEFIPSIDTFNSYPYQFYNF